MTPVIDPDAPWWANLLVMAVVVLGGMWLMNRKTNKDVGVIKDQVKNTHSTNLREDMDALREDVKAVHETVRDQGNEAREDRRDLHELRRDFDAHVRSTKEK